MPDTESRKDPSNVGALAISVVVVTTFCVACLVMLFVPVKDSQVANIMFGALIAGFTGVVQYWIGSTIGSRSKDRTINDMSVTASATSAKAVDTVAKVADSR